MRFLRWSALATLGAPALLIPKVPVEVTPGYRIRFPISRVRTWERLRRADRARV